MFKKVFLTVVLSFSVLIAKELPSSSMRKDDGDNKKSIKDFSAACNLGATITEISLNNVRTFVHMDGILWSSDGTGAAYEIPKNSGKSLQRALKR